MRQRQRQKNRGGILIVGRKTGENRGGEEKRKEKRRTRREETEKRRGSGRNRNKSRRGRETKETPVSLHSGGERQQPPPVATRSAATITGLSPYSTA
jgi:hypothetical protein